MKTALLTQTPFTLLFAVFLGERAQAQVNSGSNGSDGALNVTNSLTIDMADHPNGIYHYPSVNIAWDKYVWFIPNTNSSPVVWLVQSNCVIDGRVYVVGLSANEGIAGIGGPGGYRGGNGGPTGGAGQGPGGGLPEGNSAFGGRYATGFSTYGN